MNTKRKNMVLVLSIVLLIGICSLVGTALTKNEALSNTKQITGYVTSQSVTVTKASISKGTCKALQWTNCRGIGQIKSICLTQEVHWCYSGGKITDRAKRNWITVYLPFYAGTITKDVDQGGIGKTYYNNFVQAEMKYCVTTYGCLMYVYPYMDLTVYGDGRYTYKSG